MINNNLHRVWYTLDILKKAKMLGAYTLEDFDGAAQQQPLARAPIYVGLAGGSCVEVGYRQDRFLLRILREEKTVGAEWPVEDPDWVGINAFLIQRNVDPSAQMEENAVPA